MPGHKFQKGNPGGPGRPRGSNIEWCRDFANKEGKKILLKWARSSNSKAAMAATTLIYAYGLGRPTEHHEHDVSESLEHILTTSRGDT